jgi:hypothetical protein
MEWALWQLLRTSRWWGSIAKIRFVDVSVCDTWFCGEAIFAMLRTRGLGIGDLGRGTLDSGQWSVVGERGHDGEPWVSTHVL